MVLVFDCGIVFLRSSYATPNGVVGGAGILPSSTDMEALTGFCGTGFGENRSSSMKEMSLPPLPKPRRAVWHQYVPPYERKDRKPVHHTVRVSSR